MIETEETIYVICDKCGKTKKLVIDEATLPNYDSAIQAEQAFLNQLKSEGWGHDSVGEEWICRDCVDKGIARHTVEEFIRQAKEQGVYEGIMLELDITDEEFKDRLSELGVEG